MNAVKKVFPVDGKIPELATLIQFLKLWFATDHIDRGILVREWAAGNRISSVQRTDSGTNADGGYVTDRGPDAHHTLDTLDLEIACALLPMDFNHFEIPGSILRRAKEIVTKKKNHGNHGATSCAISQAFLALTARLFLTWYVSRRKIFI